MRKFLIFAALVAGIAQAEIIATGPTKSGGEIRLTNERSNCPGDSRFFYTTTPSGDVLVGCWSMLDGDILATYRDGAVRLYPVTGFSMKTPTKQRSQAL